jgi:cytochrome P450
MKLPDDPRSPSLLQTIHLIAQPTEFLETCTRRYGAPFTLRVLGLNSPPVVFFSNPQAIQELFAVPSKQFDFSKGTDAGGGLRV